MTLKPIDAMAHHDQDRLQLQPTSLADEIRDNILTPAYVEGWIRSPQATFYALADLLADSALNLFGDTRPQEWADERPSMRPPLPPVVRDAMLRRIYELCDELTRDPNSATRH